MTPARVAELTNQLDLHKRLAVGATSPLPPFPETALAVSEVTFKSAVTATWTWYSERMRHDIQFLLARTTRDERAVLSAFSHLLDDQRHYNEHANYARAKEAQARRDAAARAVGPPDRDLVEALLKETERALATLCQVAGRVRQSPGEIEAWRRHVAVSPTSEMLAVLADMGRDAMDDRRLDYAVRRFTGHPGLRRARPPADRARIAAVVALEVNLEPLTVQYERVLDEFGLIGDPMATALLLVAHGVEAAGYTGGRLMEVLRKAWPEIQTGVT